ncbi:MAG: hypothetical protein KJ587_02185 [Alphaproteobacteria bacterium]|nr:hypothetical protein [Alphaproteobacteria bacterium]
MANSKFSNAQGLSDEARKAATNAFEALSQWRDDMAKANEDYSTKVFDQMAQASRAMGWPENMIDAARDQMQEASRMQLQMMDQLMDTWSKQVKSPDMAMANPADFMEQFKKFQQMGMGGGMPGMPGMPGLGQMPGMSGMAMAPFQMWMQAAEMWQRNMASAMSMWSANLPGDQKKK